jgi:hypothetical protein
MVHLIPHTYELSLHAPYKTRKGMLLEWPNGTWTEASPLEGWSHDKLEDVLEAVKKQNWNAPLPSLQFALQTLEVTAEPIPYCGLLAGTPDAIREKAQTNGISI